MNAPSMESIFLILSGVILAAGVLYWFWSHIQLTQKKVQLLENAVFELRGLVTARSSPEPDGSSGSSGSSSGGGGSSSTVYNDLADDEEEEWLPEQSSSTPLPSSGGVTDIGSTPLSDLNGTSDLQPGGRLEVPTLVESELEKDAETSDEQFRELFAQRDSPKAPASVTDKSVSSDKAIVSESSLESMPVKELRRLAEQRGLTGVSDLRKKELLAALRQQITSSPASEKADTVVVERTLDLTETDDLAAEATVLE
jgi:hypothetical protein